MNYDEYLFELCTRTSTLPSMRRLATVQLLPPTIHSVLLRVLTEAIAKVLVEHMLKEHPQCLALLKGEIINTTNFLALKERNEE